jgi:hypothetical protein
MVNILTRTAGAKWLIYLGAALLLVATVSQTAHFCGFQSLDPCGGTQLRADSPNTRLCLTCLMAQSVAAVALSIAYSPILRRRVRGQTPQIHPRPFLESFQLYVRPPPVF